ncbi:MAG: YecA family protein [Moraxellaceae bacterium]
MHELHALPPETRELLQEFLDSDDNANGLDYVATHGFLAALTVGPDAPAVDIWLPALFDDQPVSPDTAQTEAITQALVAWQKEIHAALYHGQPVNLPCALTLKATESTELNDWCVGFMEGMFLKEASWYDADEDYVADLTLPMVVLSDLIDDDELQHIRRDVKLTRELSQQIPDVLTELYLFFHAPKGV